MIHDIYGVSIEHLSEIGIYAIYHEAKPERLYIGSTTQVSDVKPSHRGFYKRFYDHLRELRLNKHHSKYLQNTTNKYGIQGIKFKILEICKNHSVRDIRSLEQDYLDRYRPVYNALKTVYPKGRKWTKEERIKQSLKMKGKPLPKEIYKKHEILCKQLTKDGKLIKVFSSIKEASQLLGIDRSSISNCISGKRPTAGGFKWTK